METTAQAENVPVRQDIMPPNPRVAAVRRPDGLELVAHIPVREANPIAPKVTAQPQQSAPQPEDKDLDNILKEVNQQVANTDMNAKKKKRFGLKKQPKAQIQPQPQEPVSHTTKSKKIFIIDAIAIMVAISLITLAVKTYH